ncbi:MAG: ATP-sensitive inward rectifier potassium channel 10 [Leptolyngbya sp. SIO1D8]|nr:ATP-sensitive inward rectifier potassium channel 10 [Leptolyngbya sp. SIO1D8]
MVSKDFSPSPQRIVNRDGEMPDIVRLGDPHSPWRDLYHLLLTISWRGFVALLLVAYLLVNGLFAVAYWLGDDAIANADPNSLLDAFFFSVQTMASIGYGAMYPQTDYANFLVVAESFVGLLFIVMATGVIFARFSVPTARILFSHYAVISPFNGVPCLMFRTANKRRNRIFEAQLWVTLVRDEITKEGDRFRRFYDLELIRAHTPLFALTWTAMHPINENSPLYGETPESLEKAHAEIIVIITGLDENLSQTIHARHSFVPNEILWNYHFENVLGWTEEGKRALNFNNFDKAYPMEQRNGHRVKQEPFGDIASSKIAPAQRGKNYESEAGEPA